MGGPPDDRGPSPLVGPAADTLTDVATDPAPSPAAPSPSAPVPVVAGEPGPTEPVPVPRPVEEPTPPAPVVDGGPPTTRALLGPSLAAQGWATWRHPLAVAVGVTVVLRLVTEWVALVSEFGVKFPHLVAQHPSLLVDVWAHWDVGYYLGLAQHGYVGPASPPNGIAFGPLYPWAIRLVHVVTGLGWVASAELWSAGALVLGLAALIHLVSSIRIGPTADAAVVLLVAWPTAFFLLAPYPESTALALVTWALVAARHRLWLLAGLCAAGAGLTKYYLVILVVPLVMEAWASRSDAGPRAGGTHRRGAGAGPAGIPVRALVAVVVPTTVAALGWGLYQWRALGSPMAFAHAQSRGWGRHLAGPWASISHTTADLWHLRFLDTSTASVPELFDFVTIVALAWMAVLVFLRVRRSYGVLLGLAWCVYTFEPTLMSETREVLVLSPFFLGLGMWVAGHRWRERVALALFLPCAYFLIARFVTGAFAG